MIDRYVERPGGPDDLLSRRLRIGDVSVPNRVFLAPMSGVTDVPFRRLAAEAGAGLVFSEMVASELLAKGNAAASLRSQAIGQGPHVVQLAGREARWMAEGARAAEGAGADIIDINMGCPAKKVTSGYSGSALMRDLDHAMTLIDATVAATKRPVTLKMRLGWDEKTLNAADLARRAENAGVQMITVHGRTRCQFYDGKADWEAIADVKRSVSVPVIVNGDVSSLEDAVTAMAQSGADGVMVGRAACGRPWLPGAIAALAAGLPAVSTERALLRGSARRHYRAIIEHYGEQIGVRTARKHLGWYIDRMHEFGATVSKPLRNEMMRSSDPSQVEKLLAAAMEQDQARAAA